MDKISFWHIPFVKMDKNPVPGVEDDCLAQHAVNALAIALDIPWEEAVGKLAEQAHRLCLMPTDPKCVRAMMEQNGFFLQPGSGKYLVAGWGAQMSNPVSVDAGSEHNGAKTEDGAPEVDCGGSKYNYDGAVAIVMSRVYTYGSYATAICPSKDGIYAAFGRKDTRAFTAYNVWIRWPDGQDHSIIPRRKGKVGTQTESRAAKKEPPASHSHFHYYQQNPGGKLIGDCVIRGIASALGISWHEAIDELIKSGNYSCVAVNYNHFYYKLLEDKGYIRHKQMKRNGSVLTGKQFCEVMNKTYHRGERIFAHVGRSHVAAILPITVDGVTGYRVEDSWDSSGRSIGEYWVEVLEKPMDPKTERHTSAGHLYEGLSWELQHVKEQERKQEKKQEEPDRKQSDSHPATENVDKLSRFAPGQWIVHPVFGEGCISRVDDQQEPVRLEIDFVHKGRKLLSADWVSAKCKQVSTL